MIVTVTSYKGGVGKTTSAVHIAAYLQRLAPTLLVDGDAIRSATKWGRRGTGNGLPFKIISHAEMVTHIRDYEHIVIDTEGNPSEDDFKDLAANCDFLVIPAVPESTANDGLEETLEKLQKLRANRYRVLLTMVPPKPRTEGEKLRAMLLEQEIPVFQSEIPRLAAFDKASTDGVTVADVKHDPNAARAWRAYEEAGREIVNG
jgi:chromosome partitioning protein